MDMITGGSNLRQLVGASKMLLTFQCKFLNPTITYHTYDMELAIIQFFLPCRVTLIPPEFVELMNNNGVQIVTVQNFE